MTIEYNKLHWWYWAVSWALVVLGLMGNYAAFQVVTVIAFIQCIHYYFLEKKFSAFSVQVRMAVFLIFSLGLLFPVIFWIPAVGLFARVSTGYCFTARVLMLMPWNRTEPFSGALVKKTFFSPPTCGPLK